MRLIGIMPVRNEAHILGLSARVALQWCDEVLVGVHESEDNSGAIVKEIYRDFPGRITIAARWNGDWNEMDHRQKLFSIAREESATHIALIDADEILTANLLPRIRGFAEKLGPHHILQLPLYNLRGSATRYHSTGLWGKRIASVVFQDDPALHWGGDRFHHREPMGKRLVGFTPVEQGDGGVLHFWGADERRLRAKHALYKLTERLRWPDKPVRQIDHEYSMWRDGTVGERADGWKFQDVPASWGYPDLERHLRLGGEPWQEAEVRRLIEQHGSAAFAGLDLFGVDTREASV